MNQVTESQYEISKREAFSSDVSARLRRAKDAATHPEILYYLASDSAVEVRRAVAKNESTPYHTLKILAQDSDELVRKYALALLRVNLVQEKLASDGKRKTIMKQVIDILSTDQSAQVRHILAETIKDVEFVPHGTAMRLANDVSREVAEPMLREFKKFSDNDLIAILENHDELWRFETVSEREAMSLKLAGFLIDSGHVSVVKKLLKRDMLQLPEKELGKIVKITERHAELEPHIVNYRALPGRLALKLAKFVGKKVLKTLSKRSDFDQVAINEITRVAARRLDWLRKVKDFPDSKSMAVSFYQSKCLDEEVLSDALSWKKNEFVMIALTLLVDAKLDLVASIFRTKSQKAIMALAWAVGFSAKFGVLLQKKLANVHPRDLLFAKGGKDFPLTEDEMLWQLDFFDIHV